ncbi:MAG: ABC transporter ATP-binding protein [Solirubrobacterales bacterium]
MLELRDVIAGYEDAPGVLNGITLEVPDGTCVGLLGPNGAGKTTLLRAATGIVGLGAGSLVLDGEDVSGRSPYQLADAGVCHIPEGRSVFPALSVRDNLSLFGKDLPIDQAVERAIEAFPFVERRIDALAGTLSGGERQMLALTRAWLTKPKIVLLDEVSMGLAPLIVDEVYEFIKRLAREGTSLLVVEQYVDRIRAVADHIYLMRNGEIRFSGKSTELESEEAILGHYLGSALADETPNGGDPIAR